MNLKHKAQNNMLSPTHINTPVLLFMFHLVHFICKYKQDLYE